MMHKMALSIFIGLLLLSAILPCLLNDQLRPYSFSPDKAHTTIDQIDALSLNASQSLVFPASSDRMFQNASTLAGTIAVRIGFLTPFPSMSNTHELTATWEDDANLSQPLGYPIKCYHWWGTSSDGLSIGLLYNINNELIEIKGLINGDNRSAQNDKFEEYARQFSISVGIPLEYLSNVTIGQDVGTDQLGMITNFTHVTFFNGIFDSSLIGANSLTVMFINQTMTSFSIYPYYDFSNSSHIPSYQAINASESYLAQGVVDIENATFIDPIVLGYGLEPNTLTLAILIDWLVETPNNQGHYYDVLTFISADVGSPLGYHISGGWVYKHILSTPLDIPLIGALMGISLILIGIMIIEWPPEALLMIFSGIIVPLYARINKKDEILENYTRGSIFGFIKAKPGSSYSEIRKSLDLVNGHLMYHLNVLLKNEMIKSKKMSNLIYYYPFDMKIPDIENFLTATQKNIMRCLNQNGDSKIADIGRAVSISRQSAFNNVRRLSASGLVSSHYVRGRKYYFVTSESVAFDHVDIIETKDSKKD
jgi:predicted transcriptional regulator